MQQHIQEVESDHINIPVPHLDWQEHGHEQDDPNLPVSCFHAHGEFREFLRVILYACERLGMEY